ncbi:MAG: GNAT family N-acetyltransferase [Bacillota bacterium]|nr:GNAT family N-acetyltransferase [Bacillota bacterium]
MIKIVYEEEKNRSVAYDEDKEVGECSYRISPKAKLWIVDHTFVEPTYRGQQIAQRLFAEIVERAREKGFKIYPLCPFAIREMERKPEYTDVSRNKDKIN